MVDVHWPWMLILLSIVAIAKIDQEQRQISFKDEYIQDTGFAKGFAFKDVTDVAINSPLRQVLVLQRSMPSVTVWDVNGTLIFTWTTNNLGYPHSITLNGSDPDTATVYITDMAGSLTQTGSYGHCVKCFSYYGKYINSIGSCGEYSNGSSLDPIQFDKVTDLAWNSKSGFYYIADGDLGGLNNRILVLDPDFMLVDVWNIKNQPGSEPVQFHLPHTIKIDVCNRVWITDTLNKRLQIISGEGKFLGELNCFGNKLVYGLDFLRIDSKQSILLTTKNIEDNHEELVSVPVKMDCLNIKDIGECKMERRFVLSQSTNASYYHGAKIKSMLHSVTVDHLSGDIYLTQLPGNTPPLKFYPAAHPPVRNQSQSVCTENPPPWPEEWNATMLLTPYINENLMTAEVIYRAQEKAMYVQLNGPNYKQTWETVTVNNKTYTIERDGAGNIRCLESSTQGWKTPAPDWLNSHNCKCQGATNAEAGAGAQNVLWECPSYDFVDWFWYEKSTHKPWRIFLNNNTNPSMIPVLGNYTMINFASHGTDTKRLQVILDICVSKVPLNSLLQDLKSNTKLNDTFSPTVEGFSYRGCSGTTQLRSWPDQFYLSATMLPVNKYDPMPTSVIYDWTRHSQHTTMYSFDNTSTSAYLINNNTYIVNHSNGDTKCISHLMFGPPHPNWIQRKCKCMGTISNNVVLSPWPSTIIAVCPLVDNRVFWTWFSTNNNYYPVIFFETLSPPGEGTSLAFAEYHKFYPTNMLIDLKDFEVPNKCQKDIVTQSLRRSHGTFF